MYTSATNVLKYCGERVKKLGLDEQNIRFYSSLKFSECKQESKDKFSLSLRVGVTFVRTGAGSARSQKSDSDYLWQWYT